MDYGPARLPGERDEERDIRVELRRIAETGNWGKVHEKLEDLTRGILDGLELIKHERVMKGESFLDACRGRIFAMANGIRDTGMPEIIECEWCHIMNTTLEVAEFWAHGGRLTDDLIITTERTGKNDAFAKLWGERDGAPAE